MGQRVTPGRFILALIAVAVVASLTLGIIAAL